MRQLFVALAAVGLGWAVSANGAETGEAAARRVCSGCHAVPPPDVLPRSQWRTALYDMAGMIVANIGAPKGQAPLDLDFDLEQLVHYYETRAPLALDAPAPWPAIAPDRFVRHPMRRSSESPPGPTNMVAGVRFLRLEARGPLEVVVADMAAGLVLRGDPRRSEAGLRIVARVPHPCHLEAADLDRDGRMDVLVADLGGVMPGDHEKGSVVWLRQGSGGALAAITLAAGLPRVADVQAADVDGDGDLDLVVAAFGWRTVGGVLILENRTRDWSSPVFAPRVIDDRAGSIHVPVADLNADGHPDFVGLLSQHHESVSAFLNDGRGGFRSQAVYQAPHPTWGSSGLSLVDLDRDGDMDVLVTNGDMLDDFLLKPYHGIRWLENKGALRFEEHLLANLPGVHRALAADLDVDGDLDVVACAYVEFKASAGASFRVRPQSALARLARAGGPGALRAPHPRTGRAPRGDGRG